MDTHYFTVKGADGKRRKLPCRIVNTVKQPGPPPCEKATVEYRLGDGQLCQGVIDLWKMSPLATEAKVTEVTK
jgi:hypothetical protein